MMLDRESHISMYTQIANILESDILSGKLKKDEKLPTEMELMETYDVSRMTARLAIKSLHDKGLVVRKQGKGTFVADTILHQEIGQMEGFYDSFIAKKLKPELMEMKVMETPEDVKEILGDDFQKCLFLKRGYLQETTALGYSEIYMPVELSRIITWAIAEKNSGYSLLTKYAGHQLKQANLSIRALPSTEEQARTLNMSKDIPVLRLCRTSVTKNDQPIEHLRLTLRSDISEFNLSVPGNFSLFKGIRDMSAE